MAGKKLDEQMEKTIRNNYRRLTGLSDRQENDDHQPWKVSPAGRLLP